MGCAKGEIVKCANNQINSRTAKPAKIKKIAKQIGQQTIKYKKMNKRNDQQTKISN